MLYNMFKGSVAHGNGGVYFKTCSPQVSRPSQDGLFSFGQRLARCYASPMARDDLFAAPGVAESAAAPFGADRRHAPLAARMRPRTLAEYAGQQHILGPGQLLRRAIEADRIQSLIFFGPPGTGKTSLAQIIARQTKSKFERLSGVDQTPR